MKNNNKIVTILGGNGYIGSYVADIFLKKGFSVKIIHGHFAKIAQKTQKCAKIFTFARHVGRKVRLTLFFLPTSM